MKEGLRKFTNLLLECVFPHFCLGCGRSDVYFCGICRQSDWFNQPPGVFDASSILHTLASLIRYTANTAPARLIEDFKYANIHEARENIGAWLNNAGWLQEKINEIDIIIPVPLHRRRLAERGYNQAEIIAGYLGKIIQKPVNASILIRSRATNQQATLNREERLTNVVAAFTCKNKKTIIGKKILMVDDVYTTGSTMQECAKMLLAAGAASVSGFTLARG